MYIRKQRSPSSVASKCLEIRNASVPHVSKWMILGLTHDKMAFRDAIRDLHALHARCPLDNVEDSFKSGILCFERRTRVIGKPYSMTREDICPARGSDYASVRWDGNNGIEKIVKMAK